MAAVPPSMNPQVLRTLIQTTLKPLSLYSPAVEELLMATCAQESALGAFRHQVDGPAIGIFQMEPEDFNDLWLNFLPREPARDDIAKLASTSPPRPIEMQDNDPFAIAMCRVHYLRVPTPLPAATDLEGLWDYYRKYYNSVLGKATQDEFNANYRRYVNGPAV